MKESPHVQKAILDLLEYLGSWVRGQGPDAECTKRWPPGWRYVPDLSVRRSDKPEQLPYEQALRKVGLSDASIQNLRRYLWELAARGFVSGSWAGNWRLTSRGAAFLRLAGRKAPDKFPGDGPWKDVELLPEDGCEADFQDLVRPEDPFQVMSNQGTVRCPTIRLTQPSGLRALWGSGRKHHRWLELTVENAAGKRVCEAVLSFEAFAEMLTGPSAIPCTLDYWVDDEGMPRASPAPDPVSVRDRMLQRMQASSDRLAAGIQKILDSGKKLPAWLERDLTILASHADTNMVFAAEQAEEELLAVAESVLVVARERVSMASQSPQGLLGSVVVALPEPDETKLLG